MNTLYAVQCFKNDEWITCLNGGNLCVFTNKDDAEYDLAFWLQDKSSKYRLVQGTFTLDGTYK